MKEVERLTKLQQVDDAFSTRKMTWHKTQDLPDFSLDGIAKTLSSSSVVEGQPVTKLALRDDERIRKTK